MFKTICKKHCMTENCSWILVTFGLAAQIAVTHSLCGVTTDSLAHCFFSASQEMKTQATEKSEAQLEVNAGSLVPLEVRHYYKTLMC
jgi:hypothetical protein